jgi:hypothetical protein
MSLTTAFECLALPRDSHGAVATFSTLKLPGYDRYRLAKDHNGEPSLLIATEEQVGGHPPASFSLKHLAIHHDIQCQVIDESGAIESGRFTIIRCKEGDILLHRYFLQVAESLISLLGSNPTTSDISKAVDKLVELFRLMTEPPRKSIQGIWAEILVIVASSDPASVVKAWHATPFDVYDFNSGDQRVEVKSSNGRARQHHFALTQLLPPMGTTLLIASVLVERSGAGTSLAELIEEARVRISSRLDLIARLDHVVALTLGTDWRHAFDARFDRELSESSLMFFESSLIPTVDPNTPPAVSDVRFKADLSEISSLDKNQLRQAGGLFSAITPLK